MEENGGPGRTWEQKKKTQTAPGAGSIAQKHTRVADNRYKRGKTKRAKRKKKTPKEKRGYPAKKIKGHKINLVSNSRGKSFVIKKGKKVESRMMGQNALETQQRGNVWVCSRSARSRDGKKVHWKGRRKSSWVVTNQTTTIALEKSHVEGR